MFLTIVHVNGCVTVTAVQSIINKKSLKDILGEDIVITLQLFKRLLSKIVPSEFTWGTGKLLQLRCIKSLMIIHRKLWNRFLRFAKIKLMTYDIKIHSEDH